MLVYLSAITPIVDTHPHYDFVRGEGANGTSGGAYAVSSSDCPVGLDQGTSTQRLLKQIGQRPQESGIVLEKNLRDQVVEVKCRPLATIMLLENFANSLELMSAYLPRPISNMAGLSTHYSANPFSCD